MKFTGKLFLSGKFLIGRAEIKTAAMENNPAFTIRLFSKSDGVDSRFYLLPADRDSFRSRLPFISSEIESWRILQFISGKKVFLQFKGESSTPAFRPGEKQLHVPFRSEIPGNEFSAVLVLTEGIIRDICRILGMPEPEDPVSRKALGYLDRTIFQNLSRPPQDFDEIILSLGDKNIQLLLRNLLHRNIASLEMLAAYIHGLGDGGQVLLNNLARGVRQEVSELVRAARISTTYRWTDEVNYIIKRNLMIAVRELGLDIRGMELTALLRLGYETAVAKEQLSSKDLEKWLEETGERGYLRELLNRVSRRTLSAALVFCRPEKVPAVFGKIISKDGIRLLMEDMEAARVFSETDLQISLLRFLRAVKDLYFTPLVKQLDFVSETVYGVRDSGALDLIVDEAGFAKTVYAIKGMPGEWLEHVLSGVFRDIFEDVTSGGIVIKGFSDVRVPESRLDFLKALYILGDEEKI